MYKGVLDSGGGEVEVAVKTLKEGSREEDRVKFLQEAAIMGQFRHHNVMTVYGVVTQGEPVSCPAHVHITIATYLILWCSFCIMCHLVHVCAW